MIKINYTFKAIEPISHFSDNKSGNVQMFRRQNVLRKTPFVIKSKFNTKEERREALISLLIYSYLKIRRKVQYGGWDEFEDKVKSYSYSKDKNDFFNKLLESFECGRITDDNFFSILDMFNDYEFLDLMRTEYKLIIAKVRSGVNRHREEKKVNEGVVEYVLPDLKEGESNFTINSNQVPFISGNSIRGVLRNLVMEDWCNLSSVGTFERRLPNDVFHQLFTGGNITDSTEFELLEKRRNYVHFCPMVGLFGSAIGNMTIQGDLIVGQPILRCLENGLGEVSFWDMMNINFNTRKDDEKSEVGVYFLPAETEQKHQMIFYNEQVSPGACFEHTFILKSEDPLLKSAFFQMLYLFKNNPYICGNLARGCGKIDLQLNKSDFFSSPAFEKENISDILFEYGELYRNHVVENSDSAWQFFSNLGTKGKK